MTARMLLLTALCFSGLATASRMEVHAGRPRTRGRRAPPSRTDRPRAPGGAELPAPRTETTNPVGTGSETPPARRATERPHRRRDPSFHRPRSRRVPRRTDLGRQGTGGLRASDEPSNPRPAWAFGGRAAFTELHARATPFCCRGRAHGFVDAGRRARIAPAGARRPVSEPIVSIVDVVKEYQLGTHRGPGPPRRVARRPPGRVHLHRRPLRQREDHPPQSHRLRRRGDPGHGAGGGPGHRGARASES